MAPTRHHPSRGRPTTPRHRRILRVSKPRNIPIPLADWRAIYRDAGGDMKAANRRARDLIRDIERQHRASERARIKETRAVLKALRKTGLFQPPRSAFRVIKTRRGTRRLLKKSYLQRSPKLKAAIDEYAPDLPERVAYQQKLDKVYGDRLANIGTVHFAQLSVQRQLDLMAEAAVLHEEFIANGQQPLGRKLDLFIAYH